MEPSKFHIHSVGIAAENKKLGSNEIEVFPQEQISYIDGELNSTRGSLEDEGVDAFGQKYKVKIETSNCLTASWLPFGSNRQTPPDIRRGERLLIWRYADVDKYYWTSTGLDEYLRRLETVVYAWSDTKDETVKVLTPDNSYYIEISTHKKHVTFATAKANGEPFKYTFQFNTKDGAVTLADDAGNYFELDSAERKITLHNGDDSFITVDKRTIVGEAADSITFKTKAFTVNSETTTVNAGSTITYNAGSSITHKTPTFNGNIATSTYTGIVNIQGMANLSGGVSMTAGGGGGASCSIAVPITATQAANFSGTTTINGRVFANHTHQGVYGPTSPPI